MSFSTRTIQVADWPTIEFFKPHEFKNPEKMGLEFMQWLDQVRARAGVAMTVSSSYRTPAYNKAVGGAKDSAHTDVPCNAVDILKKPSPSDPNWNYARWRIISAAMELGCTRIGLYPNGSIHLDRSEHERPAPRLWVMVDNPA